MDSKASNSVMTRARAKYGRRLTAEDFAALSGLSSLHEAVTYLRTRTHFAPYFERLASDPALSRSKIESVLKSAYFSQAKRLCGFEKSVGEFILKYLMLERETDIILDHIVNLSLGTPEKTILKGYEKFNTGTRLDIAKLLQITNGAELARFFAKTKYAKLAEIIPKTPDGEYDISLIETTIAKIRYKMVFDRMDKGFPADSARVLSNGICMRIELADFQMIYRAKKYFDLQENYIRTNMIGMRYLLAPQILEKIISAHSAEEALRIFESSRYSSMIHRHGIDNIELFCKKAVIETDIKMIHFSTDPAIVLTAYLRYLQTECENVTKIIEGIAYKVPKEEILKNLIIIERGA